MANQNPAGKVQTVRGLISPDELGVTLTHEHILSNATALIPPPAEANRKDHYYKPVSVDTLGYIRHYGDTLVNADDFSLRDVPTAIQEVSLYKQHGGNSLVEASSIGLGRDPIGLARISRGSGINIIMGASYYVPIAHPPDMDSRSEDDLVEGIVRDVTEGVDGTGIRSGVIGEVGCWYPLTDNGLKVLRASGRAQRITGAPISIHPGRNVKAPLEIIDILSQVGAELGHTVMGHLERTFTKVSEFKAVAESGCYLEWDLFGEERSYYDGNPRFDMPSDDTRIDQIGWLIAEGYGDKLLVAHDIAYKHRLVKNGGHGYCYILAHVVPRMRARGFSEDAIHKILVDNPRAVLTFSEPQRDQA